MKKVLLIDNDQDYVTDLEQTLNANGYQTATTSRADDGLRMALAFKPDIIVLEVMLENDTAGFEFAYQLRSDRESSRYREIKDTPILLVTAINQATNFRFSLNEKASFLPPEVDMLTKPVPIDVLLAKIRQLTGSQ
jgi:DNA-binding response OmpR family regulator